MNIRAFFKEQTNRVGMAFTRSQHQRGRDAFADGIDIGASVNEQANGVNMTVFRSRHQRGLAIVVCVCGMDIGASVNEQADGIHMPLTRGKNQRGSACPSLVDIYTAIQQAIQVFCIAVARGIQ